MIQISVLSPRWHTYSDMLKILTQLRGAGNHLPLSNPLLQLIHLPVELVKPILLLQTTLSFLHQVLQWHVQTVNLRLPFADVLTTEQGEVFTPISLMTLCCILKRQRKEPCVIRRSPVWMSHLQQLSALLWQQADGLGVVLDGLLKDQMFLQQLQCAWLILVGIMCNDKQRCLIFK